MQLPIINGIYSTGETDFGVAYPVNMVAVPVESGISKGYLRPADGIVPFCTLPGLDRGGINWNGAHYRVAGSKFVRIDPNGAVAVLGDVGYGGRASFDYSFERLGISASGKLFYYDGAAFVEVTDPDLGTVVDMLWVDGYFMTTDGEFLVTTELTDPTSVSPFKYGSSEIDPDPIVAIKKINNNIYAVNRYSIEAFGNTGGEFFPFSRIEGAQAERGAVGTHAVAIANGMLVFIGSGRNESFGLYASTNGETQKLSTREIDRILNSYTEEVLSRVIVEFFLYDGHENIMIHLPDKTLSLDMKASAIVEEPAWSVLSSGTEKVSKYRGTGHVYAFNNWFVADPLLPRLGVLSKKVSTHWDQEVMWEFYTSIVYNEAKGAIFHELELITVPGDGTGTLGVSGLASTPGIKAVPPSSDVGDFTGATPEGPPVTPSNSYFAAHKITASAPTEAVYAYDIDSTTLSGVPTPGFSDVVPVGAGSLSFSNNNKVLAMGTKFLDDDQANYPGLLIYREDGGIISRVTSDYADMLDPIFITSSEDPTDLIGHASGQRVAVSASGNLVACAVKMNQLRIEIQFMINPFIEQHTIGDPLETWLTPAYLTTQDCIAVFEYNASTNNYDLKEIQCPQYDVPPPRAARTEYPAICPFYKLETIGALTASEGFTGWFNNGVGLMYSGTVPPISKRGILCNYGDHYTAFAGINDPMASPSTIYGPNTGYDFLGEFSSDYKSFINYANGDQYRVIVNARYTNGARVERRALIETESGFFEQWEDLGIDVGFYRVTNAAFSPDISKLFEVTSQGHVLMLSFTPDQRAYKTGPFEGAISGDGAVVGFSGAEPGYGFDYIGFSPDSVLFLAYRDFNSPLLLKKNAGSGVFQPVLDGFGQPYLGGVYTFNGGLGGFAFKNMPVPQNGGGSGATEDPGWPTTPGYDGVPSLILNGDASYKATQGVGGTVWASYSTDGRTWSQERPAKTGRLGDNKARLRWFKNGMMRHWRIQKFRGTSSAFVSIAALEARIEPLGH